AQPAPAAVLRGLAHEDPVEPGAEARVAAEAREAEPGAHEGVLRHVVGRCVVAADEPPGEAAGALAMRVGERREAQLEIAIRRRALHARHARACSRAGGPSGPPAPRLRV